MSRAGATTSCVDAPRVDPEVAACVRLLAEGRAVTLTARGRSMTPAIADGDTVEVLPWPGGTPRVGEVVLALVRRDPPEVLLHRVVAREGRAVRTAGDAARRRDDDLVPPSRILGHVPSRRRGAVRMAWARAARDLRSAWRTRLDAEHLEMDATTRAVAAWCRALGATLRRPGEPRERGESRDGASWGPHVPRRTTTGTWARLEGERLAEAAAALASECAGELPVDADRLAEETRARALRLEATLAAVGVLLRRADRRARLLRGPALAARWPWPWARTSSDVDLVAHPDDVVAITDALLASGWMLERHEARAWSDDATRRARLAASNRLHLDPPPGMPWLPVELHWHPLPAEGAMCLFDLAALEAWWPRDARDPAAGDADDDEPLGIAPPSVADALLLGALHWVKHHARPLREVFDAAILLRALDDAEARHLERLGRRAGAERAVVALAWTARTLFGAPLPPGWPRAMIGPLPWILVRWRFAGPRLLARLDRRPRLPGRLVDLIVLAPWRLSRWARLVGWFAAPSAAYLAETYGRPDRPESTRVGGIARAWHRALWRIAARR